jgi:hypothetical protein
VSNDFTPNAVAEANWVAYQRARDSGHDDWLETAKLCDKFYLGDQWDQKDLDRLDAEGRPALTINEIIKVVNAFLGKQATQRADFDYKPARDTDEPTATALNQLVEQIMNANNYDFVEREVFEDGIITDRGYFDCRVDFSANLLGEIRVRSLDPYEVLPDPDAKSKDPSTWSEVTLTRWMSLSDIENHYGKKKRNEVAAAGLSYHTFGEDSIRYDGARTFGYDEFGSYSQQPEDINEHNIRAVRVLERQHKQMTMVRYFVDPVTGEMKEIPGEIDEDRAEAIARAAGVGLIKRPGKRIRWTVTVDNVTLHESWAPYRTFTVIPYFPFFRRGKTSGVVRQLISPQEQFNKIESQMLHIVNTTANSGWIAEEGSLTNMTTEELEERGAETGLVIITKRGAERPEKIQPNQIPTGLDRLASRAQMNVAGIAGIEGLVGTPTREVSGVALDQLEARGLIQVDVPFDSMKHTRLMLGKKMLELIQDFYTETRVLRVTVGDGLSTKNEELIINGLNTAGEIINDMTLGEYDLVVSSKPARDNYEDSQFANALQMREAGVMVPDDVVIRASQLDNKHEIADRVAQLQGVAPPSEEEVKHAQAVQQLEMQMMQLQAAEMQGKVMELNSRAQMNFAKAAQLEGQAQIDAYEAGMTARQQAQELAAKLQMFYDDLQNKLQLAGIHAGVKREGQIMSETTKKNIAELNFLAKALPTGKPNASSS